MPQYLTTYARADVAEHCYYDFLMTSTKKQTVQEANKWRQAELPPNAGKQSCQGLYDMKFQLQGGISDYVVGHELGHSDFRLMTERTINSEMTRMTEPSLVLN